MFQGYPGLAGPPGLKGLEGCNGTDGNDGLPGEDGMPGERGLTGLDGLQVNIIINQYLVKIYKKKNKVIQANTKNWGNRSIYSFCPAYIVIVLWTC